MAHELRLTAVLAVLVVATGCYGTHDPGDADASSPDAPDARLDAPAGDARIDPCERPRAHVGVCAGAISTGTRLAVPFGNRGLWATAQSDRLVQLVSRSLGTGFGVVSVSADLGDIRTELDVPPSALREDGVDFEISTYLGPADSRCTHWLAEFVSRDGSARRSLVFEADSLPSASFRAGGAIADGAVTVASRATADGRLLALATTRNDLTSCASEPQGYELFVDDVALDGTSSRIATLARNGSAPLAAVARDGGFVVVDRSCASGELELVHVTDDGAPRVLPIVIPADGVPRIPHVPAEGAIGVLLSKRPTFTGLELSIERFDVETGASVGARQAWESDAILASRTVPAVDREGNAFWAVTLAEGGGGSSDWLVSFPADGSAPTAEHLVDRTSPSPTDGTTRLRWWDGRLIVDTRTDGGLVLVEIVCGG